MQKWLLQTISSTTHCINKLPKYTSLRLMGQVSKAYKIHPTWSVSSWDAKIVSHFKKLSSFFVHGELLPEQLWVARRITYSLLYLSNANVSKHLAGTSMHMQIAASGWDSRCGLGSSAHSLASWQKKNGISVAPLRATMLHFLGWQDSSQLRPQSKFLRTEPRDSQVFQLSHGQTSAESYIFKHFSMPQGGLDWVWRGDFGLICLYNLGARKREENHCS